MSNLAWHLQHYKVGQIGLLAGHNYEHRTEYKTHSNPDIDPARSHENMLLVAPATGSLYTAAKQRVAAAVTGRIRSDSNWITETITYPPEGMSDREQLRRYFQDVVSWHQDTFGAANVLAAAVHLDETTPHLHLDLMPITEDGRLAAKSIFTRKSLTMQHTNLAAYLAARGWDIQRGDSTAGKNRHTLTVKEYKKQAERDRERLTSELVALQETKAAAARDAGESLETAVRAYERAENAQKAAADAQRVAKDAQRAAADAQKELDSITAELQTVRPSERVMSIETKGTIGGKVKISKEDYDTLVQEARTARIAVRDACAARDEANYLRAKVPSTDEVLREASEKRDLQLEVRSRGYEIDRLKDLIRSLMSRAVALWDRLVMPLRIYQRGVWTFREAEDGWQQLHQPVMKAQCVAARPEIAQIENALGGERNMIEGILTAKGESNDTIDRVLRWHCQDQEDDAPDQQNRSQRRSDEWDMEF